MADDDYADDQYDMDEPDGQSQPMYGGGGGRGGRAEEEQFEEEDQQQQQLVSSSRGRRGSSSGGGGGGGGGDVDGDSGGLLLPSSSALSSIHASHLSHIRTLQRANAALSKKVEYLTALQSDSTKMKLVGKQQRLLREKQLLVDDLAEIVVGKGAMTAEALAARLQALIERGALDQPNPAQMRKELAESRREQSRMAAELSKARKQIRALEAGGGGEAAGGGGGSVGGSARGSAHANARADFSALEAERATHTQISAEYLTLSSAHTSLQSSHHALQLSLSEHKRLVADVTEENRTLRAYLSQWEASEERRILAEQNVLLLQEAAARSVAEREGTFQELRAFRHKLLALAAAKAAAEEEAARAAHAAQRSEHTAREHAAALRSQIGLLQTDLRAQAEIVAWHRQQSAARLAQPADSDAEAVAEKAHKEEVGRLQRQVEAAEGKLTLLLQEEDEDTGAETQRQRSTRVALLRENGALRASVSLLESRVGELEAQAARGESELHGAVDARKQSEAELAVLQRALQQMALDLQALQRTQAEQSAQLRHATEVKIPKMRAQRESLAQACRRQNDAIREMARQLEEAQLATSAAPLSHASAAPRSQERRESRSRRHGNHSHSHAHGGGAGGGGGGSASHKYASASAVDISAPHSHSSATPTRPTGGSSSSQQQRPASAHAASHSAHADQQGDRDTGTDARAAAHPIATSASYGVAAGASDASVAAGSEYATATPADAHAFESGGGVGEWSDPSGVWARYATEDGQAWYFYNAATGESVWTDPLLATADQGQDQGTAITAAAGGGADADPFEWHGGGDGDADTVASSSSSAATAAAAPPVALAAASSAAGDTARSGIHTSDLELTPLPSARLWDDMPQLSARGATAIPPAGTSAAAARPGVARHASIAEDGDGDEFAVDAPSESEPPTARPPQPQRSVDDGLRPTADAIEDEFGVAEEEFF